MGTPPLEDALLDEDAALLDEDDALLDVALALPPCPPLLGEPPGPLPLDVPCPLVVALVALAALGLPGQVDAPHADATPLTHCASHLLLQQYASPAQTAAAHASHPGASAPPTAHGECVHAPPPEPLVTPAPVEPTPAPDAPPLVDAAPLSAVLWAKLPDVPLAAPPIPPPLLLVPDEAVDPLERRPYRTTAGERSLLSLSTGEGEEEQRRRNENHVAHGAPAATSSTPDPADRAMDTGASSGRRRPPASPLARAVEEPPDQTSP